MVRPWYCTMEDVTRSVDIQETARAQAIVRREIGAAANKVDSLCKRVFYPWTGTRYVDWPSRTPGQTSYRVWLDASRQLVSLTSLKSGGETIDTADVLLEPQSVGPPYDELQLDLSSSARFSSGATFQRSLAMTGVFGFDLNEDPAGTLAASVSSTSATSITVSDGSAIGVGSLLRVDSERMIVTARSWLTSAQTLQTPLTASAANVAVVVTTGSAFNVGELVLLDSERMLIVDIAGNTLTVKRAQDGSVLATHTGSIVYVSRTLTVARGVLGTTAATHSSSAAIVSHVYPPLVNELATAEAIVGIINAGAGYARTIGSGENVKEARGAGLLDLRKQARSAFGRKARHYAV